MHGFFFLLLHDEFELRRYLGCFLCLAQQAHIDVLSDIKVINVTIDYSKGKAFDR